MPDLRVLVRGYIILYIRVEGDYNSMYIVKKTGYVVGSQNLPSALNVSGAYKVAKIGRVLTLGEDARLRKNTDPASIRQGGYQYYRIIAENDDKLCAICEAQADRVIPVVIAREGVNFPPFHPNCRCTAVGDDSANPNHDPWMAEKLTWVYIKSSDLTFLEKCELLDALYGDFDEDERKAFARDMARLYASDPEIVKVIEAFGNGAFAKPVNPVPGGTAIGNDFPKYSGADGTHHGGRDFTAPEGASIVSATAGKVVAVVNNYDNDFRTNAVNNTSYGNYVVVETADGSRIYYAHMIRSEPPLVKVGDTVEPGTPIGEAGSTGRSTGNHLHIEVRKPPYVWGEDGDHVDPYEYIPKT